VPWFCDVYGSDEGAAYFDPFPFTYWPDFACIDPARPDEALDLSHIYHTPTSFYARLFRHVGEPPGKVQFKVFKHVAGNDKVVLKVPLGADARPFSDAPMVSCNLNRPYTWMPPGEVDLLPATAGTVHGDRLKVRSPNAKLKLKWDGAAKQGWLVLVAKKGDFKPVLEHQLGQPSKKVLMDFELFVDGVQYELYAVVAQESKGRGRGARWQSTN
jgi:hypothetical protein